MMTRLYIASLLLCALSLPAMAQTAPGTTSADPLAAAAYNQQPVPMATDVPAAIPAEMVAMAPPMPHAVSPVQTPSPSVVSAVADAEPRMPLSLSSAILYALSDNPDVKMAMAREEQAAATTGKARSQFFPLIDLMAQAGPEMNNPSAGTFDGNHTNVSKELSVTARQMVWDWNKTRSNLRQQKQLESSAKLDTQVNIEEAMNSTIDTYLAILQFQQNLKEQTAFVNRVRELVGTITQMFEAGATSKAMMDYANSRLAAAENDNNTIRANLNDAVSNLEFLTGPLPAFAAENPDDLDPARLDLNAYVAVAEKQNAGVQLSQSDLQALAYKLEVSKKTLYPTLNLVANYGNRLDDGGDTGRDAEAQAFLQLNFRLYDGGERKNDIKLTKAQIKEAEISQERIMKDLRRLVKQSYNQITASVEARKQTMKEIASSEALQKLNRQNFEQGSINVIELIEGEERLNQARLRLNTQTSDLYLNTYRLLITSGFLEQNFFCGACAQNPNIQPVS